MMCSVYRVGGWEGGSDPLQPVTTTGREGGR